MPSQKTRRQTAPCGNAGLTAMLDLFVLGLLFLLARQPTFGIDGITLPDLLVPATGNEAASDKVDPSEAVARLELRADGTVLWKNREIRPELVGTLIRSETTSDRPIDLLVHVTEGRISQGLLSLMAGCSESGVWKNIRVQMSKTEAQEEED